MIKIGDALFEALEAGEPVLVASRQRAVALQLGYAAAKLAGGQTAWTTPPIAATARWIDNAARRLRAAGAELPRLLGVHEEALLWLEAAIELTATAVLLRPESIAEGLARAARRAAEYRIPAAAIAADPGQEARWLAYGMAHVERRAAALGALPRHRLWEALGELDPAPLGRRTLRLAGSATLTPALRHLFEVWNARGARILLPATDAAGNQTLTAGAVDCAVRVERASDPACELRIAAQWCARQLAADPDARLLLVIPELERRRTEIDRVLRETLEPAAAFDRAAAPRSFGFEGGAPLAQFPLVTEALSALRLLTRPVSPTAACTLLEARFWPEATGASRARVARWLRSQAIEAVDAPGLQRALEQASGAAWAATDSADLAARWRAVQSTLPGGHLDAADWAPAFVTTLEALGWPGAGAADSAGQQALEGWRQVLQQFADLGAALGACAAARAVDVLTGMARREAFAPLGADVPVLVTAAIEDPLVHYDGIRVCGLHAAAWPPPARLDPFIPWALQRSSGMPETSAPGCLQQAREALQAWRAASTQLCLSSAARDDETELEPSPVLGQWPAQQVAPQGPSLVERLRLQAPGELEALEEAGGSPWPSSRPLPRGVRTLDLQNTCPFRAYAEIRLGGVEMPEPQPGVSKLARGEYLHRVLELIWAEIGDSSTLAALDEPQRRARVERAAEGALGALGRSERSPIDPRSVARERARAVDIALGLLTREAARAPFRVIEREWAVETLIAGVPVRLRIDRVDRFEDGRLAVLDYKTGKWRKLDWVTERAQPVQLFTYALALQAQGNAEVAALGQVHLVRRGKVFNAKSAADNLVPDTGAELDWIALRRQWHAQAEQLAAAFVRGAAEVDPLADACRICHLQGVCRRAELEIDGAANRD